MLLLVMKIRKLVRKSKQPPGPWKLPLIGSLHHLLGLPHQTFGGLAQKYGPIMHLQLGQVSTVVISSPNLAKDVMRTNDLKLVNRSTPLAIKTFMYGCKDLAFATYGDYWRQLRKICNLELLSAKRVQCFRSVREEEVSNLIQSISSIGESSLVNLTQKIFSSTNDIVSRVVFGKKCKDKHAFLSLIEEGITLTGGFCVADLFPSLKFLHVINGMKAQIDRIHRELDIIVEGIMNEHKKDRGIRSIEKDHKEEDLVDVLLRLQEEAELDSSMADDNIKAVILDIFTAGTDTSATTLEYAMSEMLRNPRVMKKAQAEVRQVLDGQTEIRETDIHGLTYLKLVIKETLRLHPPLPLLIPRECRERCEIDGYEIPVNTKVIVNAWALGRDPEHWIDPEKFFPERFNGVSVDFKGTNFVYLPFGAGRRMCPGQFFGIADIELPLAQLLYHFDWKLPNGGNPETLDMTEVFGSTVRRKNCLYLHAIPYSPFCVE